MLSKLQITVDRELHPHLGSVIQITISRFDTSKDIHVQRIVPNNDFESYFDYVWDVCKDLLDQELKNAK